MLNKRQEGGRERVFDGDVRMERACPNYRAGLAAPCSTAPREQSGLPAGNEPEKQDVSFRSSLL